MFLEIAQAAGPITNTGDQVTNGLSDKIAGMLDYLIGQIPSWIAGFIFIILSVIVAKIAKAAVESRISDQVDEEHQEVLILSGRVTYVSVITVGFTVALKIAGIDLTTILAAVAFGVGFALRSFIANFFAGVYILTSRQFAIGDIIQIGSTIGRVEEIQSRATILKTYDGYKVIVPNSDIFTKQVISQTTNPIRRLKIPLYISYDTDIGYAMKIALKIIKKHPKILIKPKPTIIVNDYGDSTIDLMARCWVDSKGGWFKIRSDLSHSLWNGFMKAGIVVPYNIYHLETEQDTAQWTKEYGEIAKKEMEKMKALKEQKLASQNGAPATNGSAAPASVTTSEPAPASGQPNPTPMQLVAESVPIEPPCVYEELEQNDENG